MKTIYCIASGEYSDFGIYHAFENKKKRDLLLKVLGESFYTYDIELDDDKINIKDIKEVYSVQITEDRVQSFIDNPISCRNKITIRRDKLSHISLKTTKEIYNLPEDELELKYRKVWNDVNAKVKYMHEVDGISYEDIMELLNK